MVEKRSEGSSRDGYLVKLLAEVAIAIKNNGFLYLYDYNSKNIIDVQKSVFYAHGVSRILVIIKVTVWKCVHFFFLIINSVIQTIGY